MSPEMLGQDLWHVPGKQKGLLCCVGGPWCVRGCMWLSWGAPGFVGSMWEGQGAVAGPACRAGDLPWAGYRVPRGAASWGWFGAQFLLDVMGVLLLAPHLSPHHDGIWMVQCSDL